MKYFLAILSVCANCLGQDFIPWFGSGTPGNNLLPDLEAQYKFDEVGGVAIDSLAAYDLTDKASTGSNASGKINRARILNPSTDDFFYHLDNAVFEIGTQSYTISFWIKLGTAPADGNYMPVLTKWNLTTGTGTWFIEAIQDSGLGSGFEIGASFDGSNVSANNPRVVFVDPVDGVTKIPLVAGSWYFVCARFNNADDTYSMTVYDSAGRRFNDQRELTGLAITGLYDGTESLMVGGFSDGATDINTGAAVSDNTLIDEMGFWNRYLSDCEVEKLASPVARDDYNSTACVE